MLQDSNAFSGFSVDDVGKARMFYADVLGVRTEDFAENMFVLKLGGGTDVFVYETPTHRPASYTHLNFRVPDIDGAVAGLSERGVKFERYDDGPIEQDDNGVMRTEGPPIAWFRDPAGNTLSVIEED